MIILFIGLAVISAIASLGLMISSDIFDIDAIFKASGYFLTLSFIFLIFGIIAVMSTIYDKGTIA